MIGNVLIAIEVGEIDPEFADVAFKGGRRDLEFV
jgi:hypothetical protein